MSTILILTALLLASLPSTAPTTAPAAKDDELIEHYVAAVGAAQKRYGDEVAAAKKVRDERIAKAEKALAAERDGATQKYLAGAERAAAKYADARRIAIAATIAAYDGMIERTRRAKQAEASAAAAEAKKAFSARALEDNRRADADARALAGITTSARGEPATTTTTMTTTAPERGPVIADHIVAAVDDFIIDVYHNGEKVPDTSRRLLNEIHGATVERVDVEIRRGDWVVFNCANNRLRWGGQSLFIAAGLLNEGQPPAFVTKENDQHWSACDDPSEVKKFIAERTHLADKPARAPESPWGDGIGHFNAHVPNSDAQPIWGESRNTWIKFVAE